MGLTPQNFLSHDGGVGPLHGMMDHDVRDPLCVDVLLLRPAPREKREPMPLITLARQHKWTLEEAQGSLETAVHKVLSQCGALIRQVLWSADHL
jgi:hypothetical protein